MTEWFETTEVRIPYEGRSTVRIESVRWPDGSEAEREIVDHRDAAAAVAVTDDGGVLLLKQYRHAVGGYVLEIPAGTLEDGEDPAETMQRELVEEIHHRARELTHLVTFLNSAGWTTERTHVYLARGLQPEAPPEDFQAEHEEADMEVVRFDVDDALTLARSGELTDAKTLIGLLLAADHLR